MRTLVMQMCVLLILLGAAGTGPVLADEKQDSGAEDKSTPKRSPSSTREAAIRASETVVITNEVLERLYAGGAAPDSYAVRKIDPRERAEAEEKAGLEALKQLNHEQAVRLSMKRLIPEARKEVAEAEAELEALEKRALAVRNPFLPRPVISAEESEEWDRMDNTERLRKTEEDIRKARERLDAAREKLARLEES